MMTELEVKKLGELRAHWKNYIDSINEYLKDEDKQLLTFEQEVFVLEKIEKAFVEVGDIVNTKNVVAENRQTGETETWQQLSPNDNPSEKKAEDLGKILPGVAALAATLLTSKDSREKILEDLRKNERKIFSPEEIETIINICIS